MKKRRRNEINSVHTKNILVVHWILPTGVH